MIVWDMLTSGPLKMVNGVTVSSQIRHDKIMTPSSHHRFEIPIAEARCHLRPSKGNECKTRVKPWPPLAHQNEHQSSGRVVSLLSKSHSLRQSFPVAFSHF